MDPRALTAKLDKGRWHGTYGTGCCPAHDDRSPSLSIREDGRILVHCHAGCTQRAVIAAMRSRGLWPGEAIELPVVDEAERVRRREARAVERRRRAARARQFWRCSLPLAGSPAERYLRGRGLRGPFPPTLRYLRDALHTETGLRLPAMLAAVATWPARDVSAVHRTYLTADGSRKAPVTGSKLMLGLMEGGAVRLAPAGPTLIVAEGIETALSVQEALGLPAWAAGAAPFLELLILPPAPLAAVVIVAADHDESGRGEEAARKAGQRWAAEGREVRIMLPDRVGTDWNDVLRGTDAA